MDKPSKHTLIRYFRGQCHPHEVKPVQLYLALNIDQEFVKACLWEAWLNYHEESGSEISEDQVDDFKERFYARQRALVPMPPERVQLTPFNWFSGWMKVAAAILLIAICTLFLYHQNTSRSVNEQLTQASEDIQPGQNKAFLTLADGSIISLSEAKHGEIVTRDGFLIEHTAAGEIVHRSTGGQPKGTIAVNTITTPNGGKYRITLPDGSRAWLNAASSLSYPIHFANHERRVKMTGEVYFEIAPSRQAGTKDKVPFFVETGRQEVQVLGTHFNVNAYPEESVLKTTLIEGSVRVHARNGQSVVLRPGQQAVLGEQIEVKEADIRQQLAWKNGDFIFQGETLESALRQVARWYDVEIECPKHLGKLRFNGIVSRAQPLSAIADMIRATKKANVTLKERRFIVTD